MGIFRTKNWKYYAKCNRCGKESEALPRSELHQLLSEMGWEVEMDITHPSVELMFVVFCDRCAFDMRYERF